MQWKQCRETTPRPLAQMEWIRAHLSEGGCRQHREGHTGHLDQSLHVTYTKCILTHVFLVFQLQGLAGIEKVLQGSCVLALSNIKHTLNKLQKTATLTVISRHAVYRTRVQQKIVER